MRCSREERQEMAPTGPSTLRAKAAEPTKSLLSGELASCSIGRLQHEESITEVQVIGRETLQLPAARATLFPCLVGDLQAPLRV